MTVMQTCSGCGKKMWNKFFAKIEEQNWHEECARCCVCGTALIGRCFQRAGQLYCTEDYTWLFRPHCFLCDLPLDPTDYVYRAKSFIQRGTPPDEGSLRSCHVDCLSCSICKRRLRCGEVFSLHGGLATCLTHSAEASTSNSKSDRVMVPLAPPSPRRMEERVGQCPQDRNFLTQQSPGFSPHTKSEKHEQYGFQVPTPGSTEGDSMKPTTSDRTSEKSETSESTQWEEGDSTTSGLLSKRPRTVLTSSQRRRFKLIFELSPKPSRKIREALAAEMELSSRVVQVWFQNQRAKTKKLARRKAQKSQRKCESLKVCALLPDASYFEDSSSGPECFPSAQSSLLESAGENQPRDATAFHRARSGGWADEKLARSYGPRSFSGGPSPTLCAFTPVVTILNSGTEELVKRMECLPRMSQDVPATLPNDLSGVSQQAVFESTFSGEQARERDGFPSDIQLMNTHALTVEICTATPTPLMFRNFFNSLQMRVDNTILMD